MLRTGRLALLSGLAAIAFAACGGGATQAPDSTPGDGGTGGGETVAVEASEFAFDPATIEVAAGEVTFSVHNVGELEHEFEIFEGDQVVDEIEGIVPGLTKDLTVTLEPGEYDYVCKLAGHEEAGMTGTLTVTE